MLLQYLYLCILCNVKMGLHKGEGGRGRQRGRGREVSVRDMGTRWNCALCLLPSAHTEAKLNSNKIRHRCALLAQTSVVHNMGEGLVTLY